MASEQNHPPESWYVHGSSDEEQRRLSALNTMINEACLKELNLRGGEKILDVGSGLGQFTRAMTKAAGPAGRVVGIERDRKQMEEALRQAAACGEENSFELRQGDALQLPLQSEEWHTFDVAHARFILEHVPDPLAVVRQMAQAVRPGGRIVLADDDHDVIRLWPEPPGVMAVWRAYLRTYETFGNDAYVGRRLVELLYQAGARPQRNTWVFFGSCAGHPHFEGLVTNMIHILRGAQEAILTGGDINQSAFDEALAALRAWGRRPDAALWYSICWAEGVAPIQ